MRQETITTNIYTFGELTEDIQEKVIQNNYDYNTQYEYYNFEIDCWKEHLDCIGFEDSKIYFSGFCSQGDGASFESDIDIEKIFSCFVYNETDYKQIKDFEKLLNLMDKGLLEFSFWSKRTSSHYYHENTCTIDHEINLYFKNCSAQAENWFYETVEEIRDTIENLRHKLSQTIYHGLRDQHEYLQSEEAISESFYINEIEFTKDGKFY